MLRIIQQKNFSKIYYFCKEVGEFRFREISGNIRNVFPEKSILLAEKTKETVSARDIIRPVATSIKLSHSNYRGESKIFPSSEGKRWIFRLQ